MMIIIIIIIIIIITNVSYDYCSVKRVFGRVFFFEFINGINFLVKILTAPKVVLVLVTATYVSNTMHLFFVSHFPGYYKTRIVHLPDVNYPVHQHDSRRATTYLGQEFQQST